MTPMIDSSYIEENQRLHISPFQIEAVQKEVSEGATCSRLRTHYREKGAHEGKTARFAPHASCGGEGGIRTPDPLSRILAFQASALGHYATSPARQRVSEN